MSANRRKAKLPSNGLTELQQQFCYNYMENGGRIGEAYIQASGDCTPSTANAGASRMFRLPAVQAFLKVLREEAMANINISRNSVLLDLENIKANSKSDIAKLKAIELQIKMLGLNEPEKVHVTNLNMDIKDMLGFE